MKPCANCVYRNRKWGDIPCRNCMEGGDDVHDNWTGIDEDEVATPEQKGEE